MPLVALLIAMLSAAPLHAQTRSMSYLDGTIALSSGRWVEAAGKFRAALTSDPGDQRSMVGYGQAILGCYDKTGGCADELPTARDWLQKADSKPEHWELLGNVLDRIASRVRGPQPLADVPAATLREAVGIWKDAISAFKTGGVSGAAERADGRVAEIAKYLDSAFQTAAQPATDLLAKYEQGGVEPRETFDHASDAVRAAAEYLPGDPRIAKFETDLQAAEAGMSKRLQARYGDELRAQRWEQARRIIQMVFDFDRETRFRSRAIEMADETLRPLIDQQLGAKQWRRARELALELLKFSPGDDVARQKLSLAETKLARIQQLLHELRIGRQMSDHSGMLVAARELESITPDPETYRKLAIAENDSLFDEVLRRKDWANAESCIAFAAACGQSPTSMRVRLFGARHRILLWALAGVVLALAFATAYLVRRGRLTGQSRRGLERLRAELDQEHFDAVWEQLVGLRDSGVDSWELDTSEALLTLVTHEKFHLWQEMPAHRLRLLELADECIARSASPAHKVRLVCTRFRLGFTGLIALDPPEGDKEFLTWQDALATHRDYRLELREMDAVWDVEFEIMQGLGPSWAWWPEDENLLMAIDDALAEDVDEWLGDSATRWIELVNRFDASFRNPLAWAVRWRCGVEYLRRDHPELAGPLLAEFLYDEPAPHDPRLLDEVVAGWREHLMRQPVLETREMVFLRERLLAPEPDNDAPAVLARIYAELDRVAHGGGDQVIHVLEPLGVASRLDAEGRVLLARAFVRRAERLPDELPLLHQGLDDEFDGTVWYYLLDVLAATEGLEAVLGEIQSRAARQPLDPVELEQHVERVVSSLYAPDWALADALFIPVRPLI